MASAMKKGRVSIAKGKALKNDIICKDVNETFGCQEGAIVRIKLQNIQTYDSVEFRPGPYLNVLIGPNGTGKSTVICAICIGLNGKPSLVNKSSVGAVVKHGCQQGLIEIELFNSSGDNWSIKRTINKDNRSEWAINNRPATMKVVDELVQKLNIQVGNLCQFLPQEKVGEFAKMSQQELLDNTQKAAGPPEMYENHQRLKTARVEARELETSLSNMNEHLEQETQKNARLEQDVQNFEEREVHLERLEILRKKRPWIEYEERRKEHSKLIDEKKEMEKNVREMQRVNAPLQRKLDESKFSEEEKKSLIKDATEKLRNHANIASNKSKAIEQETDKMEEAKGELKAKQEEEQRRRKKVRDIRKQLETLENELANVADTETIQPQIDTVNRRTHEVNREITAVCNQQDEVKLEINNGKSRINQFQQELRRMQDVENQKMELLRRSNRNAFEAVKWLRANGQMFKKKIHEPLMLVINVRNPEQAKYIENQISRNDMFAFLCEDASDRELFLKHVYDQQKLKVNAIDMPSREVKTFKPDKPIGELRKYGFQCYMREMVDCPEAVMRYLCINNKFYNIPVGTEQTKNHLEAIRNNERQLSTFYTNTHQYVFRQSRYDKNNVSSRSTEVRNSQCLSTSVDVDHERQLKQQLQEAQNELRTKEEEEKDFSKSRRDLDSQLNQLRNERKELLTKKDKKKALQNQIKTKQQRIASVESEKVDIEDAERRANIIFKRINDKKIQLLRELLQNTQKCLEFAQKKTRFSLQLAEATKKVRLIEIELRETSSSLQNLERKLEELKEHVREIKDVAKRLLEIAKKDSGLEQNQSLPEDLKRAFDSCPNTLEELDARIHEEQARADLTIQVDHSVVQEFRDRERRIARLKGEVEKKEEEVRNHQEQVEEIKSNWFEPLRALVERINRSFGNFFKALKCAGEVDLNVPDNPEDYEKYGIRIKVKFRDNEQLAELTVARQSGGERSVSTILYVMALQELARVPFRCVDEINQGMDPVNERRIFEFVVQTACRENTSQYFLLTPKLLPDLTYSDKMTVHCIFNGPYSMNHKEWNLKRFLKRRAKLDQEQGNGQ